MGLRERIGIDIGRKLRLEEAIAWAAEHEIAYIDVQLDTGANALDTIDPARTSAIRRACERAGVHLGLHTSSAVNVAEYAPYVGNAVDSYLRAYIDAAAVLGAEWIVMHAGFHFTADIEQRMQAGRDRLQRVVAYAEAQGALVLLENLNKEPTDAEIHYLAHTIEEWRFYFDHIQSRHSASRSRRTMRTSCPKACRGLSMPWTCRWSKRSGSPTVCATAMRCT